MHATQQTPSNATQAQQPQAAAQKGARQPYSIELFLAYHRLAGDLQNENVPRGGAEASAARAAGNHPEVLALQELFGNNAALRRLFSLAVENLQLHAHREAIFFADKLVTLTDGHPLLVYLLGETYFANGDYKKVHSLFARYKVLNRNANFQVLAARALLRNKQYEQCLSVLDLPLEETTIFARLEATAHFLRGQCYESNENKAFAIQCYTDCLRKEPTHVEAFSRLVDSYLISGPEREQLLAALNFPSEDLWLKKYYAARVRDADVVPEPPGARPPLSSRRPANQATQMAEEKPIGTAIGDSSTVRADNLFETLSSRNNLDILCIKAKHAYARYDIDRAYELCLRAIREDPLCFEVIPIYCCCLLELNYLGELYYCAHNLVENYSGHPLPWFAVGVYYFLNKKYETARKYFQKANLLDRNFAPSWLAFAHSFAVRDESDQAMSVYRTCARLFPGCYLAQLYIGMEFLRTNNLKSAMLSFSAAKDINPSDPFVYNEIGVILYKQRMYAEARETFMTGITLAEGTIAWVLEILYTNLGHTFRKMKDYKSAVKNYEKVIALNPRTVSYTHLTLPTIYSV
eukprot:TRINITY_DN6889_c0_g1_i5.p1 TRINITY_DN6889_c0_g1~~TRINITY_DN6889_c0_g1_i5.p1  ORF type:complete len:577 (-),score=145.35 TRINITY_DN6889_c0_g1_i5:36-1766(-)